LPQRSQRNDIRGGDILELLPVSRDFGEIVMEIFTFVGYRRNIMKIGIKGWSQSVPEVLDELTGMLGMLALVVLIATGFLIVYTLHPR
jgi:hypothetical protein